MDTAQRALPKSDVPKMDMRNASFVQKYVPITLFRNKRFALNEIFQQNTSKFAIFYV